jgi:Anthrone oxygenase
MPVAMPLSVVLDIVVAFTGDVAVDSRVWRWLAAGALSAALISTLTVNVGINLSTARWDAENPPADWERQRRKWEFFQALRSWLLLVGFFCLCVSVFA